MPVCQLRRHTTGLWLRPARPQANAQCDRTCYHTQTCSNGWSFCVLVRIVAQDLDRPQLLVPGILPSPTDPFWPDLLVENTESGPQRAMLEAYVYTVGAHEHLSCLLTRPTSTC